MITLEDKLDLFYKIVFKREEERCKQVIEELEEKNKSIIKEKEDALKKRKQEIINRRIQLGQAQKNEMVSKAIQENRERVLSKRQEFFEDLLFSLEEKGRNFVSTKEYKAYLLNSIKKAIDSATTKEAIIYLSENDKLNFEKDILTLAKEKGVRITIKITEKDIIGGFIFSDINRTYNIDNSFKTIIEENKYIIGKTLYKALEEAGD